MRSGIRRAFVGLVLGVVTGSLALMVAFGRAALVGSGRHGSSFFSQDPATLAPPLLVAFALGGALLGLLAPLRRTALGAFALGLIAAGGFMLTVFIGLEGRPAVWSSAIWWSVAGATLVVGLVVGGQLQPSDSSSGEESRGR